MNEEELKNVEQTKAKIFENGFVIKNADNFIREVNSDNLSEIINRLNDLEVRANEGINVSSFVEDIAKSLNSIEELVNGDLYFRSSVGANDFQNLLNNMRGKFTLSQNMLKAEEILNGRKENLKSVERSILELKKNDNLDDVTRTEKTVELKFALDHAKQAQADARKFYDEQKALYDESLKSFDVMAYKNDLLSAINAIDTSYRKLSLEPSAMDKLAKIIRDARDKIVVFGFETQKSEKEFADLCKKYGLEKSNSKIKVAEEVKNSTEILSEPVIDVNNQPSVEETFDRILNQNTDEVELEEAKKYDYKNANIENQDQLAKKIKELNPLVEIKYNTFGHAESVICDNPEEIKLPNGFKYTEGLGFNNKVNDGEGFINLMFEQRKNRLTPADSLDTLEVEENKEISSLEDLIYEVKKLNPSAEVVVDSEGKAIGIKTEKPEELKLPNGYSYDKELGINNKKDNEEKFMKIPVSVKAKETEKVEKTDVPTKSSIPEGKVKVKKTRKAILTPYAAAILKFGALGGGLGIVLGASAGIGFAAGLPVALAGAAIGAIGQTIYNKIVLSGKTKKVDGEELFEDKNVEKQEWSSAAYKSLKDKTKVLWKMLKEKLKNKEEKRPVERKEEVSKPEVVNNPVTPEQTDSLLEYLEAQNQLNLDDDQINYDSILDWNLPDEERGR